MNDMRERLAAAIEKHASKADAAPAGDAVQPSTSDAAPTTGDAAPTPDDASDAAPVASDAASTQVPETKPVEDTDRYARMEARNRELLSEVEKLRTQAPRSGLADQAAKAYLQDPQRALRMLVAAGLEIEDLESKDIDSELEGLLLEAAGKDLGVPLEPTKKLEHEQRRLRHQLRLQQTERKPAVDADDDTPRRLDTIDAVAKPLVEKYPHARDLAEYIDGRPLREIVNQVIITGVNTGHLDGKMTNEQLVSAALEIVESRYKRIGDRILANRKPAESPTSGASDKQGARTVTTSNASVAPTKAPEPTTKAKEEEPVDEEARRAAIFRKHFNR